MSPVEVQLAIVGGSTAFLLLVMVLVFAVDWRRIFGLPSLQEVQLRQRAAEAQEKVSQIFAGATAKMQRRSGTGDMFHLGDWRKW